MNIKKKLLLIIIIILTSLVGLIALTSLAGIFPSFPQVLFGQLQLTRESVPISPRAYQSAEFILGQVDLSAIKRGVYIHLQDDLLFWDPVYPGFPQTELNGDEIRQIQEVLSGGLLFTEDYLGQGFNCVDRAPGKEPVWRSCPEGGFYQDQFLDYQLEAGLDQAVGLVLIYFANGKVAEIRIYPGELGTAYQPYEKAGDWWFVGVGDPIPGLEQISSQARVEPIQVLWPEKTAEYAHDRGRRVFGSRYEKALVAVLKSSQVREVFGPIQEIRPALGNNYYSSWMDSSAIFLSFYIRGSQGEGVVIIQGEDCFDLRMVFEGKPQPDSDSYFCP